LIGRQRWCSAPFIFSREEYRRLAPAYQRPYSFIKNERYIMKMLQYNDVKYRLLKKAHGNVIPIKAMFEITYRCNLRCRHCYVGSLARPDASGRPPQEMNTREICSVLDQLAETGCLTLGFTGGEPLMRKDIFDIMEYAKKKGFSIILITNGTLITPRVADRLKALALNKIDISFHSKKRDVFDRFTRVPGTYEKVVNAVRLCRERGIDLYFKTSAMTINRTEIHAIRKCAIEEHGAHFRWSHVVSPTLEGMKDTLRYRLTPRQIMRANRTLKNDIELENEQLDALERDRRRPPGRKPPRKKKTRHTRLFSCGAGRTEIVINPYGEMRTCVDILEPTYPLREGTFQEGWKILQRHVARMRPGPAYECDRCAYRAYCDVCPALSWLECRDYSACPAHYKELARMKWEEACRKESASK
jgi:radical SAM protein with 4Fe4S-binding SPASM domain